MPPGTPSRHVLRGEAGSTITWGEELQVRVLQFRAELFTLPAEMLARKIWTAAQSFSGRTFAEASRLLAEQLEFPEVWERPEWGETRDEQEYALRVHRRWIREEMERRSAAKWREAMARACPGSPFLVTGGIPISAGMRLLEAEELEALPAADDWSRLRAGMPPELVAKERGQPARCVLCGQTPGGLAHLTASCQGTEAPRATLRRESPAVRQHLGTQSNDGEWVALIFSGTVAVSDLKLFVGFAAELVRLVRAARATRAAE